MEACVVQKAAARFAEQYGQILDDFAGDAAAGPEQLNTVKLCRLRYIFGQGVTSMNTGSMAALSQAVC